MSSTEWIHRRLWAGCACPLTDAPPTVGSGDQPRLEDPAQGDLMATALEGQVRQWDPRSALSTVSQGEARALDSVTPSVDGENQAPTGGSWGCTC